MYNTQGYENYESHSNDVLCITVIACSKRCLNSESHYIFLNSMEHIRAVPQVLKLESILRRLLGHSTILVSVFAQLWWQCEQGRG